MAIKKNVAGQKLQVFAVDSSGIEKTGDAANITARISLDGGAVAQTNDVNPTEIDATYQKGLYYFNLTQAETNADMISLSADSATAGVVIRPVIVYTELLPATAGAVSSSPFTPDLTTVEELLQDVIHETNIGDVPDFFKVVNRIVREIVKERQWRHYVTDATITVLAAYDTGTVSMTQGLGTVTGLSTVFTSAMVGRKFRAANGQGIYDITGYTSPTEITISPVWPHAAASAQSFQIYQDTYDFPSDMMFLLDIKDAVTERCLDPMEYFETLRRWESFVYTEQSAIPPGFAWPWEYAQFGWNSTTSCYQVVVDAVADTDRALDVIYRRWPGSVTKITDTPDIPKFLEEVLRLRLFKHFIRRRNANTEIEVMDRRQRLQEWMGEEATALYTAKTADGMLIVPYLRNRRVLV